MKAHSILTRLRWSAAVAATLVLLGAVTVFWWLSHTERRVEQILVSAERGDELLNEFSIGVAREIHAAQRYVVNGAPEDLETFQEAAFRTHETYTEVLGTIDRAAESARLVSGIQLNLGSAEAILARAHRLRELGREDQARDEVARAEPYVDDIFDSLELLITSRAEERRSSIEDAFAAARATEITALGVAAAAFLLLAGAAWGVGRTLTRSLRELVAQAESLREGNLDVRTDVSAVPVELRGLAETLNRAGESLEQLSRQEDALRRAEKLSAIGMLVSGVAHELNNPLAGILLTVDDALDTPGAPSREDLETIRSETRRARETVQVLLTAARARDAAAADVDVNSLVERISSDLDRISETRDVAISFDRELELSSISVDEVALRRATVNLVDNAALAAAHGRDPVRVTVSIDADEIEIVVEDRGPGIPPEVRSRIFDPFFSGWDDRSCSGLGLTEALSLVEGMGGSLNLEDLPARDRGVRAVVRVPTQAGSVRDRPESGGMPGRAPPIDHAGERRALVVDDEPTVRLSVARILKRYGWSVEEASDGARALQNVLGRGPASEYHLIISDLNMPGMSGMEFIDRLLEERPAMKDRIIVVTGDNVAPGPAQFLSRTGLPGLDKPFEIHALLELIEEVTGIGTDEHR